MLHFPSITNIVTVTNFLFNYEIRNCVTLPVRTSCPLRYSYFDTIFVTFTNKKQYWFRVHFQRRPRELLAWSKFAWRCLGNPRLILDISWLHWPPVALSGVKVRSAPKEGVHPVHDFFTVPFALHLGHGRVVGRSRSFII